MSPFLFFDDYNRKDAWTATRLTSDMLLGPEEPSVFLSSPSSKYKHEFKPIREFPKLTVGQSNKASENHVTHVCVFDSNEPKWLIKSAEASGYKAVCLGYTRHRKHGFVTKEVWGLAKIED